MRTRSALCAAFLALALIPSAADAQFAAEVDYATKYLFAGTPFAVRGDGAVSRATLSFEIADGFTLNGFGVWDYETSQVSEADLYAEYGGQAASILGYYVGGVFYNFLIDDRWQTTYELYGGLTLDAPLSPTLHVAHDLEAGEDGLGDGTRAFLQLSQGIPLGVGGPTFTLAGRVEYNDEYYTPASGFAYADLIAAVELDLGLFTLVPAVTIQRQLDKAFAGFIDDEEVFSIAASFGF